MTHHAGYAAVVGLTETAIDGFLRVLYHANSISHRATFSVPGFGVDLFVDRPRLHCSAAAANRFALDLRVWGELTIETETRRVLMDMRLLAPPLPSISAGMLTLGVDVPATRLDSMEIFILAGGEFSDAAAAILNAPETRSRIETGVRLYLGAQPLGAPLAIANLLGDLAGSALPSPGYAVLNGAFVIGIDVSRAGFSTRGTPGLLIDVTAGHDLGLWINQSAVPLSRADFRLKVEEAVAREGATLDEFALTCEEGHLRFQGLASRSEGSVSFSAIAIPHLVLPGTHEEFDEEYGERFVLDTPPREELWFELRDVEADVHRPSWATLAEAVFGVLTIGAAVAVIEEFVETIRGKVVSGIEHAPREPTSRTWSFTLARNPDTTVFAGLRTFEVHSEGLFSGVLLREAFPDPVIYGIQNIAADEIPTTTMQYSVRLPYDSHRDDPQLHVRWICRRSDTGQELMHLDGAASGLQQITLDSIRGTLPAVVRFTIECRVYRVLGVVANDLFNGTLAVSISDRFDRSHPFVRWRHDVWVPSVTVESDGSHTFNAFVLKTRRSAIHRTAVPGRCRMLSRMSEHVRVTGVEPQLEYLEALPFPHEQIVARRAVLCDYCFFGGPTRTVPLI